MVATEARRAACSAAVRTASRWTALNASATRFALLNGAHTDGPLPAAGDLSTVDRWILSRLAHVTAEVDEQFEAYEFAKVCDLLYHFAWATTRMRRGEPPITGYASGGGSERVGGKTLLAATRRRKCPCALARAAGRRHTPSHRQESRLHLGEGGGRGSPPCHRPDAER
ncbi:class I tRNA ligase family protein [Nocardia sp. NPDC004823]